MSENKNHFEKIIDFIILYKTYFIVGGLILVSAIFIFFSMDNPTSFQGMVKKADSYAEKGKVAFALEEYSKIVRLYPDNYDIHMKLANIYIETDELEKAKIEYIRAIRLGYKYRYDANLALAKIYGKENRFDIAEDLLKDIKDTNNNKAQKGIGNLYYNWGKSLKKGDRLEAIRKFKKSCDYYKKAGSNLSEKALGQIASLFAGISDTLVSYDEDKKAIETLGLSIAYKDNAIAHYKLAKIYEKSDIDKSLKEYSKAFELNSNIGNKNAYISLLMKKAKILAAKENEKDKAKSRLYYMKAKKLDVNLNIPENPDSRILFNLIATKVNEDMERDILIPGIIFNITNISKELIKNLKVKIIFIKDNKQLSMKIIKIADKKTPLKGDDKTSNISIYSDKTVRHVFDDHNLRIQVYISQKTPDKWKLFRNIPIIRKRKPILIEN